MSRLQRVITQYRRSDDSLVRDYELPRTRVDKLRRVFGADQDDPMTFCYPVTEREREFVEDQIDRRLNMRDYEYFLETHSASDTATPGRSWSPPVNGRSSATSPRKGLHSRPRPRIRTPLPGPRR